MPSRCAISVGEEPSGVTRSALFVVPPVTPAKLPPLPVTQGSGFDTELPDGRDVDGDAFACFNRIADPGSRLLVGRAERSFAAIPRRDLPRAVSKGPPDLASNRRDRLDCESHRTE